MANLTHPDGLRKFRAGLVLLFVAGNDTARGERGHQSSARASAQAWRPSLLVHASTLRRPAIVAYRLAKRSGTERSPDRPPGEDRIAGLRQPD